MLSLDGRCYCLIHTYHSVPTLFACRHPAATMPRICRQRHIRGMAEERHGNGMVCVNQTRPHCVNQMGNTQSKPLAERHGNGMVCVNQTRPHSVNQMGKTQPKPLAERHGRGAAWERRGMCESAFKETA
jgi:hypothetical protein